MANTEACCHCHRTIERDFDTDSGWSHTFTGLMFCNDSLETAAEPSEDWASIQQEGGKR